MTWISRLDAHNSAIMQELDLVKTTIIFLIVTCPFVGTRTSNQYRSYYIRTSLTFVAFFQIANLLAKSTYIYKPISAGHVTTRLKLSSNPTVIYCPTVYSFEIDPVLIRRFELYYVPIPNRKKIALMQTFINLTHSLRIIRLACGCENLFLQRIPMPFVFRIPFVTWFRRFASLSRVCYAWITLPQRDWLLVFSVGFRDIVGKLSDCAMWRVYRKRQPVILDFETMKCRLKTVTKCMEWSDMSCAMWMSKVHFKRFAVTNRFARFQFWFGRWHWIQISFHLLHHLIRYYDDPRPCSSLQYHRKQMGKPFL